MIPEQKQCVVIVAGGSGTRLGADVPKQFVAIGGKPILMHTIEAFHGFNNAMRIVLVLAENWFEFWKELCQKYDFSIECTLVAGGETRFHSVKNGLSAVPDDEIVAIHDAARPFVSQQIIAACFEMAAEFQCGAIPVTDEKNSVRFVTDNDSKPIDRTRLKIVQTPQVFPAHLLKKAYDVNYTLEFTDDASVAEKADIPIRLVQGDEENFKITTPFDLLFAEALFSMKLSE